MSVSRSYSLLSLTLPYSAYPSCRALSWYGNFRSNAKVKNHTYFSSFLILLLLLTFLISLQFVFLLIYSWKWETHKIATSNESEETQNKRQQRTDRLHWLHFYIRASFCIVFFILLSYLDFLMHWLHAFFVCKWKPNKSWKNALRTRGEFKQKETKRKKHQRQKQQNLNTKQNKSNQQEKESKRCSNEPRNQLKSW